MKYEHFKNIFEKTLNKSLIIRKLFYSLLNILFLRIWYLHRYLKIIRKNLPEDARVLDAGSGMGQNTWWIARHNNGWKIKGVDIITDQIENCTRFFIRNGYSSRVSFETADLENLNEENNYDLIISVDVMEHIENDLRVFKNFFNALRSGGILLVTTPSDKGGSDTDPDNHQSFIDEHVRSGYSPEEISEKLKQAGFGSIDIHYTYGKPGHIAWVISIKLPVMMINRSLFFLLLLPFYYLFTLPAALVLNAIDVRKTHKSGTGLFVIAVKN